MQPYRDLQAPDSLYEFKSMEDGWQRWFLHGGARILPSIVAYKVCETDHKTPQLQPLPDLQLQSQVGKSKQSENPEVANKSMYLVNNAK